MVSTILETVLVKSNGISYTDNELDHSYYNLRGACTVPAQLE